MRKDLSFIGDPAEQSLLTAFLRALYDPAYIDQCADLFGFVTVPTNVRNVGLDGINMLRVAAGAPVWTFETSTRVFIGQGDYVISRKRRTYNELALGTNEQDVAAVMVELNALRALVEGLQQQIADSGGNGNDDIVEEDNPKIGIACNRSVLETLREENGSD